MYYPSEKEFIKLSNKGNLIAIYKELPADLDTPVSIFLKLSGGSKYACLLESVEGQEKIARYSFMAFNPKEVLSITNNKLHIAYRENNYSIRPEDSLKIKDPLREIKRFMRKYKFVRTKALPRFCGGLLGYLGYDIVRFFENIPDKNPDYLGVPDGIFLLTDTLVIFDHLSHKLTIVSCAFLKSKTKLSIKSAYKDSVDKIESIAAKLKNYPLNAGSIPEMKARRAAKMKILGLKPEVSWSEILSGQKAIRAMNGAVFGRECINADKNVGVSKEDFSLMVKEAKEYIKDGDIIQVVLSQILSKETNKSPFSVYRSLRGLNPSSYMFYLKLDGLHLVGSSPEMLVRCEDKTVITRPIAGTRPRGKTPEEDKRLEKELLSDEKERAEHIMLVDLGRNDLGRVCVFGSIRLSEFMRVEKYSHVMHIVSEVRGRLKKGLDIYDVLRAAFPAGTVTGSPKIRAMEIIDELESYRRGPYAGAVGYFSFSGNLDTCITIRTIVINNGRAYVQAGAGIVSDSIPRKEYQETINKAKAQLEAL